MPIRWIVLLGLVVGWASRLPAEALYSVTWLGAGVGQAINNRGQVAGWAGISGSVSHAFLYSDGQMIDLGTLGGTNSLAFGINDRAQIYRSKTLRPGLGPLE